MDSMIFVIAIFVIAIGVILITTTIRKLREEVNQLKEENKSLKEENKSLKEKNDNLCCSEQSLLWQRENLRNEVLRLLNDAHYYYDLKDEISQNFRNVAVYKNGRQIMSFDTAWVIATKMVYNWS